MRFRPLDLGRIVVWTGYALALAAAPLVFTGSFALTLLSQMGIAIVFALSYNMLFGQGGMLSFGHAVYAGLGAYVAAHVLNMIAKGLAWPVTLLPIAGGLGGALFAVLFGYPTTRRAGTTFAMITLGIGEMVFACVLMLPGFFGGEGGITVNRTSGGPFLGIGGLTLGPAIQVYYLIAAWCFLATGAMFAFSRTPLGRIANAVRDNPERAEFIGYDPARVRYLVMIAAGFFAGIAGALSAINYEIVNAENVGAVRSGEVLIATFIGGAGFFFGPILGAIVFTLMAVAVGTVSKAWLLYLGVLFIAMVMYAPGGLASLILANLRMARHGQLRRLVPHYGALAAAAGVFACGAIGLVEMTYQVALEADSPAIRYGGLTLDTHGAHAWIALGAIAALGTWLTRVAWRAFRAEWDAGEAAIGDPGAAG